MADGIVGWHFFDAESGALPEEFGPSILPGGGAGRIVVLAATPFARAEGWAAKAVVSLARGWAERELRIFLMDLGLDAPSLHEALGVPNHEGVSDAFLYGASVQRIAQPALGEAIFFASSGTATTDPEQILAHPRWNDLAGGFSEADATLLLYLPTELPGADRILNRATDVLFLAGQGESSAAHLGQASVKVLAMFGPMGSPPEDEEVMEGMGAPEEDEADLIEGPDGTISEEMFSSSDGDDSELAGTLRLADGFVAEVAEEEPISVAEDEEPVSEESEEEFGPHGVATGDTYPDEIVFDDDMPATGDAESAEPGIDFAAQEVPAQEPPDFGADFADMPDLDEGAPQAPASSPPFGEVVQGSAIEADEETLRAGLTDEEEAGPQEADPASGPIPPGARPDRFANGRQRPKSRLRPRPRRRFPFRLLGGIMALLAVVVAVGGTALGWFVAPGFGWLAEIVGEEAPPEVTVRDEMVLEPSLLFSLELYAYEEDERGLAVDMRNTLRERHPDLLFNLTPVETEGAVRYLVHAGPAADMVEAENLRAPLGETLIRDDSGAWRIRSTPLAFSLGRHESLSEAEEAARAAEVAGVLAYIVQLTFPDSTAGFEVLSGAFGAAEDTRWWYRALQEAGFRDALLVERRGRPPE